MSFTISLSVFLLLILPFAVSGDNMYSLDFNGTSNYVEVADDSVLNPVYEITLEAWIKPVSWGHYHYSNTIVGKEIWGEGVEAGYVIRCGDSGVFSASFGVDTGVPVLTWAQAQTTQVLELDTWTHVASTWDGSIISLYVNGEIMQEVAYTGTIICSENTLKIGDVSELLAGHRYFDGLIDEVRVWNIYRSHADIIGGMWSDVTGAEGLIGYWKFETGSGVTAFDSSGYENNGVIYGASWSTDVPEYSGLTNSTWGRIKAGNI